MVQDNNFDSNFDLNLNAYEDWESEGAKMEIGDNLHCHNRRVKI